MILYLNVMNKHNFHHLKIPCRSPFLVKLQVKQLQTIKIINFNLNLNELLIIFFYDFKITF